MGYNELAGAALASGAALILAGGVISRSVRGVAMAVVVLAGALAVPLVLNGVLIVTCNDAGSGGTVSSRTPTPRTM
jgi:hypothetical protein